MLYLIAGLPFSGQRILIDLVVKYKFYLICYEDEYSSFWKNDIIPERVRTAKGIEDVKVHAQNLQRYKAVFILRQLDEWAELYLDGNITLIYLRCMLRERLRIVKLHGDRIKSELYYHVPAGLRLHIESILNRIELTTGSDALEEVPRFLIKFSEDILDAEVLTAIDNLYNYCEFKSGKNDNNTGSYAKGDIIPMSIRETMKKYGRKRGECENITYSNLELHSKYVINIFKFRKETFYKIFEILNKGGNEISERMSWDEYFMSLSEVVSSRANCMKRRTGAVYVSNNRIVSTGYNGTASNTTDCIDEGCHRCCHLVAPKAKFLEDCLCLHAEQNALLDPGICRFENGEDTVMYCTVFPCIACTKIIIQFRVKKVVYLNSYSNDEATTEYMRNHGIIVERLKVQKKEDKILGF